jgi:hypothetical protein
MKIFYNCKTTLIIGGIDMKKTIVVTSVALLLATAPAMAQMMGSGSGSGMMGGQDDRSTQQMMEQQQVQQTAPTKGQNYSPQYMTPGMMGRYGYGMGPGMMGGYGMGPGMMGNYGYGMGPGMMGYYSPEQYEKHFKEHQEFLNDTHDLRKKLHTLKFDFVEAQRNPDTKREDLEKMNAVIENIWKQIYEQKKARVK